MGRNNPFRKVSDWLHANYHWVVAAILFMMLFAHGGSINNFTNLHLVPISEHLSISRAEFSLAFSLKGIVAMLTTFFSGFLIARFGCRLTMSVGLILTGCAYCLFAQVTSVAMLSVSSVIMGLSYGFCTTSAAVAVVRVWFHRHEGTVLGIVSAATGVGSGILSIVQTAVMEMGSFRSSLYLCAGLAFGLVVLVLLFVRNRPEDMGLVPLGAGERKKKRPKAENVSFPGMSMDILWKQPAFYLMLFATLLVTFSLYMAFNVVRNFFIDSGFSVSQATGLHSAMMLMLTFTKLFSGVLCDKMGARKVNLICVICGGAGLLVLSLMQDFYTAAIAVVLYTISLPLLTLLGPLLASDLFGYRSQMQCTGILVSAVSLANLSASYVTNLIYDTFRSYRPSFLLAAVLSMVAGVLFLILYGIADKLRADTAK